MNCFGTFVLIRYVWVDWIIYTWKARDNNYHHTSLPTPGNRAGCKFWEDVHTGGADRKLLVCYVEDGRWVHPLAKAFKVIRVGSYCWHFTFLSLCCTHQEQQFWDVQGQHDDHHGEQQVRDTTSFKTVENYFRGKVSIVLGASLHFDEFINFFTHDSILYSRESMEHGCALQTWFALYSALQCVCFVICLQTRSREQPYILQGWVFLGLHLWHHQLSSKHVEPLEKPDWAPWVLPDGGRGLQGGEAQEDLQHPCGKERPCLWLLFQQLLEVGPHSHWLRMRSSDAWIIWVLEKSGLGNISLNLSLK